MCVFLSKNVIRFFNFFHIFDRFLALKETFIYRTGKNRHENALKPVTEGLQRKIKILSKKSKKYLQNMSGFWLYDCLYI